MQDEIVFIGVDVAKEQLAIATQPQGAQLKLHHDDAAITQWLGTLRAGSFIAMESTGRYHQLLGRLAVEAGMKVYVLNAYDIKLYAKALGKRGKTDASDAQVIARYLAEHHQRLHPWVPGTALQQRVDQMLRRRATIERHLGAIDASLHDVADLALEKAGLEGYRTRLLDTIDAKIQALIASDLVMHQKQMQLQSITGVGPHVSALLAALMSRIEFPNVGALIAYSGLDPRPNDSGKKRGRRTLSKRGPACLRKLLWLSAFSACHSKVFKPLYQSIKARGFSGTQALVILARKLLRVAWGVWRTGQPFDPAKLQPTT